MSERESPVGQSETRKWWSGTFPGKGFSAPLSLSLKSPSPRRWLFYGLCEQKQPSSQNGLAGQCDWMAWNLLGS